MTDLIFKKGDIEFKLSCILNLSFSRGHSYMFKLMQRQKGNRKWLEIKGYENTYSVDTNMVDILKYVDKSEVMMAAKTEYDKYAPSEAIFIKELTKK